MLLYHHVITLPQASYACLDPSSPMAMSKLECVSGSPLTDYGTGFSHLDSTPSLQTTDYYGNNYGNLFGEKSMPSWGDPVYHDKADVYKNASNFDDTLRGPLGRSNPDSSFGSFARQLQVRPTIKQELRSSTKSDGVSNEQQLLLGFNSFGNSQEANIFSTNERQEDWSAVAIDQLMTCGGVKKSSASGIEQSRESISKSLPE